MAEIVVTTGGDVAHRWTRQFCRQFPWTIPLAQANGLRAGPRNLIVAPNNRAGVVGGLLQAAAVAGRGGTVIHNIGHGNGNTRGANVMLATDGSFTVTSPIIAGEIRVTVGNVQTRQSLSPQEGDVRESFMQIGAALQRARIARFVFLVCGVGGNRAFMNEIKTAWGGAIEIVGYNDGVVLEGDAVTGDPTYPRIRLYLFRDGGDTAVAANRARLGTNTSATPRAWLEMPTGMVTV